MALLERTASDSVAVTDSLELSGSTLSLVLPTDVITVSDTVAIDTQTFERSAADSIAVTDSVAIKLPHAGTNNLLDVPSGRRTFMKQRDTLPTFSAILQGSDGAPVILVNSSARFLMRDAKTRAVKVDRAAVITNPTGGRIEFAWAVADTDRVGFFDAEVEVTYDDGSLETFPSQGAHRVEVVPNAS